MRGVWLTVSWPAEIDSYCMWLTAKGSSAGTISLRRRYLTRLSQSTAFGPWQVNGDTLVAFVATPGWKPETRKSVRSAVRSFYRWAITTERILIDPSQTLPSVRVPTGLPKPTPETVLDNALRRADLRGRLMILLGLHAGLRRSEIAQVHTDDVTVDAGGFPLLRVTGKGGKVRMVPLHPLIEAALATIPRGYVFPGKEDGHLSADRVGHILADLLGKGWTAHSCRHRFATDAYAVQRDLFAVQQLLGHSKPETTARYTALPHDALRAAVIGSVA